MTGRGTYIWQNGASFEGAFRDDEISGPGYYKVSLRGESVVCLSLTC